MHMFFAVIFSVPCHFLIGEINAAYYSLKIRLDKWLKVTEACFLIEHI
jgi:hypothetical protein